MELIASPKQSPVVFIVFNRPEHTARVFESIRKQQPLTLYIIADGPRLAHPLDKALCDQVRSIVNNVDWPCEVHRNFSDVNLGNKRRVGSGLNWVFRSELQAIILEDDCLPHPDFFWFCNQLLDKYADDPRVATITGNNFQKGIMRGSSSYYFSKYTHSWGWATWRRTWTQYEPEIPFWPEWKMTKDWRKKTPSLFERAYWRRIFDTLPSENTWDYPFIASVWKHGGLTATPNVNLVTNIGFDEFATHTKSKNSWLSGIPTRSIGEMRHPVSIGQNFEADRFVFNRAFGGTDYFSRMFRAAPKIIFTVFLKKLKVAISKS